jgi:hypothetical protein
MFRLDSHIIKPTGSLVRCSKCRFIFIVQAQDFNDQPKTQDTNIDQSILDDLYSMEHAVRTELPLDVITEEWNNLFAQGALSIENFDEEAAGESDSNNVDTDSTDLPDLSEYENMIDLENNTDSGDPSVAKRQD